MKALAAATFAIAFGLFFAYVDSRPNFDDTGVLAFSIAGVSFLFGSPTPAASR